MRNLPLFALVCTLAAGTPPGSDHPRWSVHVSSGKGESYVDEPSCHKVKYFLMDPQDFDYGSDLFGKKPEEIKDKAESRKIGAVAGYNIYQVIHNINDGELVMKMILVERRSGEFCEIYHQQHDAAMVTVEPAYLVQVGGETILATTDPVSGTGAGQEEHYWAFDKDGPVDLDVWDKIFGILKTVLPKGLGVMKGSGFDLRTLTYSMPVWKETDANCCPSGGTIEIRFAVKDHHLIVVSQNFDPS